MLRDFTPTQTNKALETVRNSHPNISARETLVSGDLLKRVKATLISAADSDAIRKIAQTFKADELRAALYILGLDKHSDIRERAAIAVNERKRRDLLRPAWRLLVENYPNPPLERLVRDLLSTFDLEIGRAHV